MAKRVEDMTDAEFEKHLSDKKQARDVEWKGMVERAKRGALHKSKRGVSEREFRKLFPGSK